MENVDVRGATFAGFHRRRGGFSRYGTASVSNAVLIAAVTPYLLKTNDHLDGMDQKSFDEWARTYGMTAPPF